MRRGGPRPPRSSAPLGGACKSSGVRPCENRNLADRTRSCLLRIVIVARTGGCADGRMPGSRDASVPPVPIRAHRRRPRVTVVRAGDPRRSAPDRPVPRRRRRGGVRAGVAHGAAVARRRHRGDAAAPDGRRRAPGRAAAGDRRTRRGAGGARARRRALRGARPPRARGARRPTTPTSRVAALPAQRAHVDQRVRRLGRDDRFRLGGRRGARHGRAAASRPRGPLPARLRLRAATFPTANDGDGRDPDPTDPGDWITQADIDSGNFDDCERRAARAGTARRSPA